jgi:hypothetical protein
MNRMLALMILCLFCAAAIGCRSTPHEPGVTVTRDTKWDGWNVTTTTTTRIDKRSEQQKLLEDHGPPGVKFCHLDPRWEKGEPVSSLLSQLRPGRYSDVTWERTPEGLLVHAIFVTKKRLRQLDHDEPFPQNTPVQVDGGGNRFVAIE